MVMRISSGWQLTIPLTLLLTVMRVDGAPASSKYVIGKQGQSCAETCNNIGSNCNPHIVTNNSTEIFQQLGVQCKPDPEAWWAQDQPSFVSDSNDPNYGKCVGYTKVPGGVLCGGSYPTTSRLCRCDAPTPTRALFGTGYSGGEVSKDEFIVFQHWLAPGDYGVMTHLWTTAPHPAEDDVLIRYYVDGETTASIEYTPSMACGVGFGDTQAPWGTQWFGKGAADGGWFNNFRIPFQKNIVVTVQSISGVTHGGFYIIVRGATNLPITVGGYPVPSNAKLNLFKVDQMFKPLDWVTIANVESGQGLHFMHTIAVSSGTLNFLEGCYHMYTPGQDFPGTLLSTGTEDYFDSGWYFNAGEFHLPVSGYTHFSQSGNVITWSAYRFHEMDPIYFVDGYRFVWRNGDMLDASGIKCNIEEGGAVVGTPTNSNVTTYAWVYTWA